MKFKNIIFFLILALGIFLRLYNLSSVPPSASLDEVSIGYNVYSILQTGKDEYGYSFPLLLRAYDDWRPVLYVYLVIPFVYVFGLTTFAVRLPSVLLSVATLIGVYVLVKSLFSYSKSKEPFFYKYKEHIALIAMLLVAISPWHIYLSRLGHEVNLGLTLILFGLVFFFQGLVRSSRSTFYFLLSFSSFGLSFYSYQSQKIVTPIFMLLLFVLFYKDCLRNKKGFIMSIMAFVIISIPAFYISIQPNSLIRFSATSAFSKMPELETQTARYALLAKEKGDTIGFILSNRRLIPLKIIAQNYMSHFNPVWLFFNFSDDRHKVPNLGLLYLWELPFIILGTILLFLKKANKRIVIFLMLWFFSSAIAGAITTDAPHAMRTFTFIPTWQIFGAIGLVFFLSLGSQIAKVVTRMVFSILVLVSVFSFSYNYFIVFPKEQSSSFQYSLSSAVPYVLQNQNNYTSIVFSNSDSLYQSYMFFLFHSKYNPKIYLREGGTRSGGFAEEHGFAKYEFKPISGNSLQKNELYIGNSFEVPQDVRIHKKFYDLDGSEKITVFSL